MMDKGGKNMDRKLNLKEQAEEILKIAEERGFIRIFSL